MKQDMGPLVERAVKNIERALKPNRSFPFNVLSAGWDRFRFFDADRLFVREFVDIAKLLVESEGAHCACLLRVKTASGLRPEEDPIMIHCDMTGTEYLSCLRGESVEVGWTYTADDFACCSDCGSWIIYAEKRNEIAMISFSVPDIPQGFRMAIRQLGAVPISYAIENSISYGFSDRALSSSWCETLIREYGNSRSLSDTSLD